MRYFIWGLLIFFSFQLSGQKVTGTVYNEAYLPLEGVQILIEGSRIETATDSLGFYEITAPNGVYNLIFRKEGYQTQFFEVMMKSSVVEKHVWMSPIISTKTVEVTAESQTKEFARKVIKNASDQKQRLAKSSPALQYDFYKKIYALNNEDLCDTTNLPDSIKYVAYNNLFYYDGFDEKNTLIEISGTVYQQDSRVKETRNGYKENGPYFDIPYLYEAQANLSIYQNFIAFPGLIDGTMMSPLHPVSGFAYNFDLAGVDTIKGVKRFKISVTPKKSGTLLFQGAVFIWDQTWLVDSLNLQFPTYGMLYHDELELNDKYTLVNDSVLLPTLTTLQFKEKGSGHHGFVKMERLNVTVNPNLSKAEMHGAVMTTPIEAYNQDSTFWSNVRSFGLDSTEIQTYFYTDSVHKVHTSDWYLDSLNRVHNRYTLSDFISGYSHYNRKSRTTHTFNSLFETASPFNLLAPGGMFLNFWAIRSKEINYSDNYYLVPYLSYNIKNKAFFGGCEFGYNQAREKQFSFSLKLGRDLEQFINTQEALSVQSIGSSNWYMSDNLTSKIEKELLSGFSVGSAINVSRNYDITFLENYASIENSQWFDSRAIEFSPFNQVRLSAFVKYQPGQKYILNKGRKIVLGSIWPQFQVTFARGIPGIFGAENNYSKVYYMAENTGRPKKIGATNYRIFGGIFLNTANLPIAQREFALQADQGLFFNPLYNAMGLNESYSSETSFIKAHFIHHFNGFFMNRIPLIRLTKIHLLAGFSGLYMPDQNLNYLEAYAGIERKVIILGQPLRLNLLGVVNSNNLDPIKGRGIRFGVNWFTRSSRNWTF